MQIRNQPYPPYYAPPPKPARRWRTTCLGCCMGISIVIMLNAMLCLGVLLIYVISPPATTNILILGNDARPGSGEEQIARTDSIMILSVNPRQKRVSVLSLPRDVFIDTPRFGALRVNTIIREAELADAGSGMLEMQMSMEQTFNTEIDEHVRISFEAFIDLVDAVGGVDIEVPKHIIDYEYPTADGGTMVIEFQPGEQHMDGETALIYARTRHGDDDYERARRQQQVIDALMSKLSNPLNVYRLPAIWLAFQNNSDTSLGVGDIVRIVPGILLYGRGSGQIERLVIDRDYLTSEGGTARPNMDKIQPWIDDHLQ